MFKKLIISESQRELLKSFLLKEAGALTPKQQKEKEVYQKLINDLTQKFKQDISGVGVGESFSFYCGSVDEKGFFIPQSVVLYKFQTLVNNNGNIRAKLIIIDGKKNDKRLRKNDVVNIYPDTALKSKIINKESISLYLEKVLVAANPEKKIQEKVQGMYLQHLLLFERDRKKTTNTNTPTPTTATNAPQPSDEQEKLQQLSSDWQKTAHDTTGKMIYSNRFLFFPRGYLVMDEILKKYGLGVGKEHNAVKIRLTGDSIKDNNKVYMSKMGMFNGVIDKENNIISVDTGYNNIILEFSKDVPLALNHPIDVVSYILLKGDYDLKRATKLNNSIIVFVKL